MKEKEFVKSLDKCSRCKKPIVEGDDHIYYKKHKFSFYICNCDTSHNEFQCIKRSMHLPEEALLEQDNYVQRKLDH